MASRDISTPQEMYFEALQHHSPLFSAEGVSCTCGEWSSAKYDQRVFDSHVALFLSQLNQQPTDDNGTELLRHFYLIRDEDKSGSSGTGRVAEGFVFEDGTTALRWLVEPYSTAVYATPEELKVIHGHQGATRLVPAIDEQPLTMPQRIARSRKNA